MAQIILLLLSLSLFGGDQAVKAIYGLKALSSPLDSNALNELAYIGVEYVFDTPIQHSQQISSRTERGLILLHDFDHNEEVFQKWIELASLLPKEILQSPDGSHNLVELQLSMNHHPDLIIALSGEIREELKLFDDWLDWLCESPHLSSREALEESFPFCLETAEESIQYLPPPS